MSKRINLTVEEETYNLLLKWAEYEDRPLANLVSRIINKAINEAIANKSFPMEQKDLLGDFIKNVSLGIRPKNCEIVAIAHQLGIQTEDLIGLCDRVFKEKSHEPKPN